MQFSIQHRALLLLLAAGCQGVFAGEGFDGSILYNGNGVTLSHTTKHQVAFLDTVIPLNMNCLCLQEIQLLLQ